MADEGRVFSEDYLGVVVMVPGQEPVEFLHNRINVGRGGYGLVLAEALLREAHRRVEQEIALRNQAEEGDS